MSAYGSIASRTVDAPPLPTTAWTTNASSLLVVHHLTLKTARKYKGLIEHLYKVFHAEVERGMTYPQETVDTQDVFEAYFFAADVFVGVVGDGRTVDSKNPDIDSLRGDRSWEDSIAGFYYVKPNYPGRSSHICNGGFVVNPSHRGRGYGTTLGRSYLHYAPKLGYKASVFNLVYVNNIASVKIWESLGFTKAGLIPKAGRLRRQDGDGEEYVDAHIFYKSFEE
ncbi:hypothetical protein PLICRDRAFT_88195 [Plicaturopsis crispa FD-325 SS-3]|nr:hypothetical protein PLICRDRAFT_88195 [Plicaturopsis crispa FD-325 SS-3]